MRFVRAYYRNGVCIAVAEQETPFLHSSIADADEVDIGLVEDFDPQGRAPSARLFDCLNAGEPLPAAVIDCPPSIEGIEQRLRERGPRGIPSKARAWLTLMLHSDESAALGIDSDIPLSALKALDNMRTRRDPHVGSRLFVLERQAQQQSDTRSKVALERRLPGSSDSQATPEDAPQG